MTKCTFHSFAHYAFNELGHPYVYHHSFQQAVEHTENTCYVYAPRQCSIADLPPRWSKWFHSTFNRKNRRGFWKDCIKLFRSAANTSQERIFFIEMFSRRDFLPFAVTSLLFSRRNDKIWVLYRDDLTTRRKKDRQTIFFFSRLLMKKFGKRMTLLTDSDLLANYYASKLDRPLTILPIPHIDFIPQPFKPFIKEKVICSFPGHPRKDKGEEVIEKLIKLADPMAARIELDLSGATLFSKVTNGLSIHLRKALLSREEYLASLQHCDLILLPHDATLYKWRTSGIFVEAIMAGKIPIVRAGTWLAHELKKYGIDDLAVDWDSPLFFTHLFSLLEKPKLWQQLQTMQDSYLQFHSFSHFVEKIKQLVG